MSPSQVAERAPKRLTDFESLAALEQLIVERSYCLAGYRKIDYLQNLRAAVAVFLVRT